MIKLFLIRPTSIPLTVDTVFKEFLELFSDYIYGSALTK